MTRTIIIAAYLLFLYGCRPQQAQGSEAEWKQEIFETEKDFANMAKEEGIEKAFTTFAAEDAVLMRNDALILGKQQIAKMYKGQTAKGLSWSPDFVSVSAAGDLGYTYGYYTFATVDSLGHRTEQKGVFHTVWKRQEDGTWLFVWD